MAVALPRAETRSSNAMNAKEQANLKHVLSWWLECLEGRADAIAQVLERELGPAYKPADLLSKLVAAGFYGIKNGRGFYLWDHGKKVGINLAVQRYLRK